MGATSNKAKQLWNTDHYTQIKISVSPELASAFKAACTSSNVSMASAISRFMAEYCKHNLAGEARRSPDYSNRRNRRTAVRKMTEQLSLIMDAETTYLDNIPENFRNSTNYENAEQSIAALDEATDILLSAY